MVDTTEAAVATRSGRHALSLEAFSTREWALLAGTALTWGSSFVWIEVALASLSPSFIALLRLVLGGCALSLFPQARTSIERRDLPAIAWLGLLWMALPFFLFPIAQQWIDSSLAGMINGGVPVVAALVTTLILRRSPPAKTAIGIALGFAGIVVIGWPAVEHSSATALGVALVVLATSCYGVAINIAVPLQRKYGSLPVLLRTQLFAIAFAFVPGVVGMADSSFEWTSLLAVVPLGGLGTGLAFVWMATLVGRVGAARGSVTIYFVPVVAIVLGAVFRDETISLISILGTALVLFGAFLASRNQAERATAQTPR